LKHECLYLGGIGTVKNIRVTRFGRALRLRIGN
jgi:hypothetical protein